MDFDWTEEEAAFRGRVLQAIEDHAAPGWGPNDFELSTPELKEQCTQFCRALAAEGLLTPNWPVAWGGRDSSAWEQLILSEEMHGRGHEPRGPQYMNVNWIGPAIMKYGTEEQRAYHLPRIAAGDVYWCQGFSEPDAGSDLAALRTTAVREGDDYIINGQKIWTSYAHCADFCFLLVRTHPDAPTRQGISALIVPMDTPGIEVRDIENVAGKHIIHEVFFRDVVVPTSALLGEENAGWGLVIASLANERIGIARFERSARVLDRAVELAWSEQSPPDDREQVAAGRAYALNEAARILNYVAVQERAADTGGPRPAASVSRVATILAIRDVATTARDLVGQQALLDREIDQQTAAAVTVSIAAGSLEMQLNNVGRLSLALPRG
jgi:alkylation response protein AidB-like acyl-CoA dehydrogenase